jgi:mannose-6-phosphate isomerase-like protein (cupin superfamily)
MIQPTRNPFDHRLDAGVPADRPAGTDGMPAAEVERAERVPKPWGHEEIVAVLEGSYVGKVLHVVAGGVLSLQQHLAKDETLAVQSGRVRVEHGADRHHLRTTVLGAGDRLLIRAQVVHRITADEDSVVLETSTARPGWRTDVVRLEDRYGRAGTSAP